MILVQLHVPKIESGNDFGVSVQEELIKELQSAEDCKPRENKNKRFILLDQIHGFHICSL